MRNKELTISLTILACCWVIAIIIEDNDSAINISFFSFIVNIFHTLRSSRIDLSEKTLPFVQIDIFTKQSLYHNISVTTLVARDLDTFTRKESTQTHKNQVVDSVKKSINLLYKKRIFPQTRVFIVPEKYMFKLVKIPEYDACFLPQYNAILLQTYLFNEKSSKASSHLLTIMSNELSHAGVFAQRTKNLLSHDLKNIIKESKSAISLLAPWHNTTQKTTLKKAYRRLIGNIVDYRNLSDKKDSELSKKETIRLKKYDQAILSYIPPAHSKDHYTANHVYHFFSNGKWNTVINRNAKIPFKLSDRIIYLRKNFFREMQNQNLTYSIKDNAPIYSDASEEQLYADLVSDFDTFPSSMQLTFGSSLCLYLTEFHESTNHCIHPRWGT